MRAKVKYLQGEDGDQWRNGDDQNELLCFSFLKTSKTELLLSVRPAMYTTQKIDV